MEILEDYVMAAKKVILFIEGESNSSNSDLNQGFTKLLEQKLKGKLPKIILGDGKGQTINKFLTNQREADLFLLLVDLDKPEDTVEADLVDNNLLNDKENVFYMIQEMECWFLSQPNILDDFYGLDSRKKKISEKLPQKKATEFSEPDKIMKNLTKDTKKGQYHKIKHAVELLKLLDATQLEKDFADFERLITKLKY